MDPGLSGPGGGGGDVYTVDCKKKKKKKKLGLTKTKKGLEDGQRYFGKNCNLDGNK